ncbi:MAG: SH3 domain-containing protein [Clostridium sp.]|nr:SH3 domain-containing protein [Clostridium sp.]
MGDNNLDYKERLDRAKKRREGRDPMKPVMIGGGALAAVLVLVAGVRLLQGGSISLPEKTEETVVESSIEETVETEPETLSEEQIRESMEAEIWEEKEAVINSYENLGIVQVSGFLNMREEPDKDAKINGKLMGGSAVSIIDDSVDGWYQVSSGGFTGYISREFVLTDDAAREKARELVSRMAVINTEKLNVREEPNQDARVTEQVMQNERYPIVSEQDGWIQIPGGYISSEYADVKYALNEARELDVQTAVLNMYDQIGISNVDNYLNVREAPSEEAPIIGKMPSKAAGEVLEVSEDGQWLKMQSGPVTGYVKAEYIMTGDTAKQFALENAKLMAIVNTDMLNVRTEPKTEAGIWTQISGSERYDVVSQQDGWVGIQIDDDTAYVATDYVDVRYALNEAIKYTPPAPVAEAPKSSGGKKSGSSGSSGSGSSSSGGGSSSSSGGGSSSGSSSGGGSSYSGGSPGASAGSVSGTRSDVVNYATQFLGNPYVYGGTSLTNGTDCSGFTMSVMNHFGVSLPHQSGAQSGYGTAVSAENMRPGDLVFYSKGGGINHVAIYIGDGQVCHASNARDGIKISTWNYRTPVAIRNVLGD